MVIVARVWDLPIGYGLVVFYGLSCRWVGSHHAMWLDALIVG